MQFKIKKIKLEIEELFLILIIMCTISKVIRMFFSNYLVCLLFISFHELSHLLLASMFGRIPNRVRIRVSGLMLEYDKCNIRQLQWLLIYLIGPISNMILAYIFRNIKMVYEVNIALCIINLLPIEPLDGYNILKNTLNIIFKLRTKQKILKNIETFSKIIIFTLSIYILFKYNNSSMLILLMYLLLINLKNTTHVKSYNIRH